MFQIGRNVCFVESYIQSIENESPEYTIRCRYNGITEDISDFRIEYAYGLPSTADSFELFKFKEDSGPKNNPDPWYKYKSRHVFEVYSRITEISPKYGFKTGGQTIEIKGTGFSTDSTTVYISSIYSCVISEISSTEIKCVIPQIGTSTSNDKNTNSIVYGLKTDVYTYPASSNFLYFDLYTYYQGFYKSIMIETSLDDDSLIKNHAEYYYTGKIRLPLAGMYVFTSETNADSLYIDIYDPENKDTYTYELTSFTKNIIITIAGLLNDYSADITANPLGKDLKKVFYENYVYTPNDETVSFKIIARYNANTPRESNYFKLGMLVFPDTNIQTYKQNVNEDIPFQIYNIFTISTEVKILYDAYYLFLDDVSIEQYSYIFTCDSHSTTFNIETNVSSIYYNFVDVLGESKLYIELYASYFEIDNDTGENVYIQQRLTKYSYLSSRQTFFEKYVSENIDITDAFDKTCPTTQCVGYLLVVIVDDDAPTASFDNHCKGTSYYNESYPFLKESSASGGIKGTFDLIITEKDKEIHDPPTQAKISTLSDLEYGISAIELVQKFNEISSLFNQIQIERENPDVGSYIYYIKNLNISKDFTITNDNVSLTYTLSNATVEESNYTFEINKLAFDNILSFWPIPGNLLFYDREATIKEDINEELFIPKQDSTSLDNLFNVSVLSNEIYSICFPTDCVYEIIQNDIPVIMNTNYDSASTTITITLKEDLAPLTDEEHLYIYVGSEFCSAVINSEDATKISCKLTPIGGSNEIKVLSSYGVFLFDESASTSVVIAMLIVSYFFI